MFDRARDRAVRALAFVLLCATALPAQAPQPLYMPRAVKRAFANGTRSPDGRPGPKYWQNHGRYAITVTARAARSHDPRHGADHLLEQQPRHAAALVIKLFINIHQAGRAARRRRDPTTISRRACTSTASRVNGAAGAVARRPRVLHRAPRAAPDAARAARLGAPRRSTGTTRSRARAGREGMIDSTTYYLAYFYPRVAVYDDYNGWDTMDFTDAQEFYSDFNDYDVTVRVPANFVVWGTGTLRNAAERAAARLSRSASSRRSRRTRRFTSPTQADLAAKSVTQQNAVNAWHFTATNVPDMAFGLSDHYDWDGGERRRRRRHASPRERAGRVQRHAPPTFTTWCSFGRTRSTGCRTTGRAFRTRTRRRRSCRAAPAWNTR